jgi:hypothetical protein
MPIGHVNPPKRSDSKSRSVEHFDMERSYEDKDGEDPIKHNYHSQLSVEATSSQPQNLADVKASQKLYAAAMNAIGLAVPHNVSVGPRPNGLGAKKKAGKGPAHKGKMKGKGNKSSDSADTVGWRLPKRLMAQEMDFFQTVSEITISSSTTLPTFSASYFTMAAVDQVASLTVCFDQYQIHMVEVSFLPSTCTTGVGNSEGLFRSVIDYDDAAALTTIQQAADYSNCIVTPGYKKQIRTFVPHVAVASYAGSFTGYTNIMAPWIDFSTTGVQHYGVKIAWDNTTTVSTYIQSARLWIKVRNVR